MSLDYVFPCKPNRLPFESDMMNQLDNDSNWIAEVKRNGIRAMIYSHEKSKEIWTRARTIVPDALPEIRRQMEMLPSNTILDGELISKRPKNWEKHFYVFDIIMLEGKLLVSLPLSERRKILEDVFGKYLQWEKKFVLSDWSYTNKKGLYLKSIGDDLLEGIVVKRLNSKYIVHPSKCMQNPYWLKVKKPDAMFQSDSDKI